MMIRLRDFLRRHTALAVAIALAFQILGVALFTNAWAQLDTAPYGPAPYAPPPYAGDGLGMTPMMLFIIGLASIVVPQIVTLVIALLNRADAREARRAAVESVARTVEGNEKVERLREAVNGQTERLVESAAKAAHAEGFVAGGEHVRLKQAEHALGLVGGEPKPLAVPVVLATAVPPKGEPES